MALSWGYSIFTRVAVILLVLLLDANNGRKSFKNNEQANGNGEYIFDKEKLLDLIKEYKEDINKKLIIADTDKNENGEITFFSENEKELSRYIGRLITINIFKNLRNGENNSGSCQGQKEWNLILELDNNNKNIDESIECLCNSWNNSTERPKGSSEIKIEEIFYQTSQGTAKSKSRNENIDPNKIYQAAELLRSFDCREQEKSIIDELENHCRGFFIIQAHTSMQNWFIWRLTKCMGNFEKIKKIQIKLNPILLCDVDNIWGEIGKYIGLTSNIDRQSLAKHLIDYSKKQATIIVIDKFEQFNKQNNHLNQFLDSCSYIFTHFQDIDKTKKEPFVLFLVANEAITKDKSRENELKIFNLTKILDSENKFNSWEREYREKLEKRFGWNQQSKSKIVFNEEPYSLVQEICSNVFNLEEQGILDVEHHWKNIA